MSIHRCGWWYHFLRKVCSLCAFYSPVRAYMVISSGRTQCLLGIAIWIHDSYRRGDRCWWCRSWPPLTSAGGGFLLAVSSLWRESLWWRKSLCCWKHFGVNFGLRPRTACGTKKCLGDAEVCRWCCRGDLCFASVGGLSHSIDWILSTCIETTCREIYSNRSSSSAVFSGVEWRFSLW